MEMQETVTAKGAIKVLIVDDDADLGMFMKLKLSMEAPHLSFAAVECGPECIEYLKSNPVDCILSDYQMPEMNGMELLLALREVGSDVPFIFVTGQGNEEVAREAFKNGAYDYFTKDIGFAHFARIINSVEQAVAQRVSEAERRRAAEALKQYQQRLQLHVKQTPLAVIDWDTGFRVVSWNPAAEKIFGYPAAEAFGRHAEFIVADSAKPHVDRVWGDLLTRSGGERSTNENVTKDGRTILCEWYNTPLIADDGRVIGVASLVHDISGSKKAEDALRASEKRFRALVENAADAFFLHDSKGVIVDVNQAACESLGYTREELLRMSVQDVETAFATENIAELWDKEVPSRPVTINGVHRRKDGTTFQVEVRVGLLDINGTQLMLALARDVSERKRAEGVLRESEERFRALTESTSDWIWETDSEGSYTYSSPQVKDILGYSPEEIIGKKAFDLMPSDEAGRVAAEFKKLASSMLPIEHFENINITADGRTVVLETSGVPFIDRDGRFCGYRGIDRDITERKKANCLPLAIGPAIRPRTTRLSRLTPRQPSSQTVA